MKVENASAIVAEAGADVGPPDRKVSVRKAFGIDSDMEAPA